jgi:hypothetical protein
MYCLAIALAALILDDFVHILERGIGGSDD